MWKTLWVDCGQDGILPDAWCNPLQQPTSVGRAWCLHQLLSAEGYPGRVWVDDVK
jgi:hypothetical protein